MSVPDPKALKEALAYIPNILRVAINDCSDSGEEADKHEARFNALVDDKVTIGQFIHDNLRDEWVKQARAAIKEAGLTLDKDWYWPVCDPSAPLDKVDLLMESPKKGAKHTQRIYGASDDLIELDGDVDDEIGHYSDNEPYYLLFNDGTQLKVSYGADKTACWRIDLVHQGKASLEAARGSEDADEKDGVPGYSDLVTLTWDEPFELVKHGSRKCRMPTPEQAKGVELAQQVIDFLSDRSGFDDWFYDMEQDTRNEIVDGLAALLNGTPIAGKTFVLTGVLQITRAEATERIEAAGGYVSSSVSSKTDYLIVGLDPGSKVDKAKGLGVKILSEDAFNALVP